MNEKDFLKACFQSIYTTISSFMSDSPQASLPDLIHKMLRLLLIISLGLWFWQQWNYGKASWESLGDAHFYGICAENYAQTGENKWFEIYPVALFQGSGAEMSFASFGFPQWISFWINMGWSFSEATLLASLLAFLAMLFSFAFWVAKGLGWDRALLLMVLILFLPKVSTYASAGGPEALSLFFLVNALGCLIYSKGRVLWWIPVITFSILGALVRPHNQIFLYGLVIPAIFSVKEKRWRFISLWAFGLICFKLVGMNLMDHQLKFGYLFSFLVGTELYPGKSLFRTYFSEGFRSSLLLEHKDQFFAKISTGIQLLKIYWPGWLPQAGLLFLSLFLRPVKSVWFLMTLLFGAILFLAAMGHLVSRYWEMLQPVVVLFFLLCLILFFKWENRPKTSSKPSLLLGLTLIVYLCLSTWSYIHIREVNYVRVPVGLMEKIESQSWVACSRPSKLIDLWKKPILLLPDRLEMIEKIDSEVKNLNALILTPDYERSEYALWHEKNNLGLNANWSVDYFDGWTLYQRRNLEKNE